jgi:hypothetical protein
LPGRLRTSGRSYTHTHSLRFLVAVAIQFRK